jgi:hypothetical protein
VGVIVHGDSTVAGHGPGVTPLLTGPAGLLRPVLDAQANLAEVFGVRRAVPARAQATLIEKDPRHRRPQACRETPFAFDTLEGGGPGS